MSRMISHAFLAELLRVSRGSVWRLGIPSIEKGRSLYYQVEDVEAWLQQRLRILSTWTGPMPPSGALVPDGMTLGDYIKQLDQERKLAKTQRNEETERLKQASQKK